MSYRHFNPHPSPLLPDMSLEDVRDYERQMHEQTNSKVVNCHEQQEHSTAKPSSLDDIEIHDKASVCAFSLFLHFIAFFLCLVFISRHSRARPSARVPPLVPSYATSLNKSARVGGTAVSHKSNTVQSGLGNCRDWLVNMLWCRLAVSGSHPDLHKMRIRSVSH